MAVTAMTGTAHRAPRPISTTAVASSGPTPIVRQSRARVSTTSRRTSATYTIAWIVTDSNAPIGPSRGTPSRSSGTREDDDDQGRDRDRSREDEER